MNRLEFIKTSCLSGVAAFLPLNQNISLEEAIEMAESGKKICFVTNKMVSLGKKCGYLRGHLLSWGITRRKWKAIHEHAQYRNGGYISMTVPNSIEIPSKTYDLIILDKSVSKSDIKFDYGNCEIHQNY